MSNLLNLCRMIPLKLNKFNSFNSVQFLRSKPSQLFLREFNRNCVSHSPVQLQKTSARTIRLFRSAREWTRTSKRGFLIVALGGFGFGVTAKFKFQLSFLKAHCQRAANDLSTDLTDQNGIIKDGEKEEDKEEEEIISAELSFPWKELLKLLIPDIWLLFGAVASALCVAYINIQIPLLLGGVVNVLAKYSSGGENHFTNEIRKPALQLVQMYGLQGLLTFAYISLLSAVGERMAARMRCQLFKSIIVQDIAFFDKNKTGEIVNRLTSDIQDFKSSFKSCVSQGLRNLTQTIGCLISLFIISPKLTGLMVLAVTGLVSTGSMLGSGLRKLSKRAQAQGSKATAVANEAVSNVRTVRAFAMEDRELEVFKREVEASSRLNQMLGVGIGVFQGLSNIALNGMVLGTLFVGGYSMCHYDVKAGDLMSFLIATQTIQRSLSQMSVLFGQAVRGLTAGTRVFELMLLRPTLPISGGSKIPHHSLSGDIRFNSVSFTYPNRPNQVVLKDFDLHIPGGKVIALVGPSGSGKSTVAALLERFYDVDSGSVTIDGKDVRVLDPSWLRSRAIGFINQEPILFADTIMENIRYGCPEATDAEVIEAAKQANADDFIRSFPDGYKTVIGERGVTVSGGQKQRIAIARALIKRPAILILDEATSALDSESERVVQEAIDKIIKGRTVLVIAHRLSTIKDADYIAVVSNGQIVEMGDNEELKRRKGLYWQLIRNQEILNDSPQTAESFQKR